MVYQFEEGCSAVKLTIEEMDLDGRPLLARYAQRINNYVECTRMKVYKKYLR
jgi:hypothetical protein